MEQGKLYLIKYRDENMTVRAKDALEAVSKWFVIENTDREFEGRKANFSPEQFTVELINREI
ncbi:hypothetical protein [Planococcus shixiaomingii]|uniref:hypothetical protein n=1 Tax=Planococcus shixiaomingii TaxID=3058393 RepID=UPI00261F4D35|nr:hypothetical protein [Planococcus sp. N022]WKA53704.1 hypothetical protein QWY21_13655 [Planococcus sp. N022]